MGRPSARSPLAQGLPEQYIPDQSIIENSKPLGQGLPVGIPLLPVYVLTRHIGKLQGTRGHVGRALAWEIFPRIWSRRGRDLITGGKEEGVKVSSCHLGLCTSCHLGIPSVLAPGRELFEILHMQFFFLWSTFFTQGCWTSDQL